MYTHPSPAAPVRVGVVSSFNQRPDRSVWHSGGADLLFAPAGWECLRQEEDAEAPGSPHTHRGGANPSNRPHAGLRPSHLSLNIHRVQRRWKIYPLAPISKALIYISYKFFFFCCFAFCLSVSVCANMCIGIQVHQVLKWTKPSSYSLSLHFNHLQSVVHTENYGNIFLNQRQTQRTAYSHSLSFLDSKGGQV